VEAIPGSFSADLYATCLIASAAISLETKYNLVKTTNVLFISLLN